MKTLLASLALLFAFQAFAEDSSSVAAVKAADKARVAAMQSGDRAKLDAVFSDELRYAHSNGIVDTKKSFIEILSAGKTKYVGYDYEEQNFTFPAPGVALMTAGRLTDLFTDSALKALREFSGGICRSGYASRYTLLGDYLSSERRMRIYQRVRRPIPGCETP